MASGAAPATTTGRPRLLDPPIRFSWPAAAGFAAWCVIVSYPGRANADSLFSLIVGVEHGRANNWHSATLGWLWALLAPWFGQPLGALVAQAALFGIAAGFLPRLPATPRGRATLALELLLRLILAGSMGYIGKDAVIVATLLLIVALVRRLATPATRRGAAPGLAAATLLFVLIKAPDVFTIVAGIALVLPFIVRSPRRCAALIGAALLVGTLAIPLNRAVDRFVFHARDVHPDKQLVIFDLAGISTRTGENAFAAVPGWPTARLQPISACYLPYMWDAFAPWAPCSGYSRAYDRLEGPLIRQWLAAIVAHPFAYAAHRTTYLRWLLGSGDHRTWGIAGEAINDATVPDRRAEMSVLTAAMRPGEPVAAAADQPVARWRPSAATAPMAWLETVFFRFPKVQWAALAACLVVLLHNWLRRAEGVRLGAIVPAALGVGNLVMLAPFGVADPGRYMWPTAVLADVALLALLAPRAAQRPSAASGSGSAGA